MAIAEPSSQINSHSLNGIHTVNGDISQTQQNAWSTPGPAAFDFRSDTVTRPTSSMLAATQNATLDDDVFHEDPTTIGLEEYVAELTGKEAGLFVTSGTMGNQLSVRTLLGGPPHSVLADARSHVLAWEAGGIASLSGALSIPVNPANGHHLTLEDVKKHAELSDDTHFCPTKLIVLENTLGGTILPLKDCEEIAAWARERGIQMHLDGARLWEAVAAGAGSLKSYASCFDTLTLCFSKGLGAPIGSIILASADLIRRARHIRKTLGGGLRQSGVVTASARVAVDETFLSGKLTQSHELARRVGKMWEQKGGHLELPVETNMVWLDLEKAGLGKEMLVQEGVKRGVKILGGRLVCHYQICEDAVGRLGRVMDAVLGEGNGTDDGAVVGISDVKETAKKVMQPEME